MDWLGLLKMAQDQGNKNGFTPANLSGFGGTVALLVYMLIGMQDISQKLESATSRIEQLEQNGAVLQDISQKVEGATARIGQLEKNSAVLQDMSQQVAVMSERVAGATSRIQQLEKSSNIQRVAVEKLAKTVADIQSEDFPKLSEKSDYQRGLINNLQDTLDPISEALLAIQTKLREEELFEIRKQAGKIKNDPEDVKSDDIVKVSRFCHQKIPFEYERFCEAILRHRI